MSNIVKSAVLSLGLLAGAAVSAYAQTDNLAALPPDAVATPPAASIPVAPPSALLGPDPGKFWTANEQNTGPAKPSPKYVGPAPGETWGTQESHTQPVQSSPEYVGPNPNAGDGVDSE